MWDSVFLFSLGFLGSFGHCVGMCGPLMLAINGDRRWHDHLWLQAGRLLSYTIVGMIMGGLGAAVVSGGQLAGIGSDLRRAIAIVSGLLLIWLGLSYVQWLPHLQHPLMRWHTRIETWMSHSHSSLAIGLIWGLLPCGFLYTAQLRAITAGNAWLGGLAMLSFGLGTLPTLFGVGLVLSRLPLGRRQALFRLGGWLTVAVGVATLLRTGGHLWDGLAYAAVLALSVALLARPLQPLVPQLLPWRRGIGLVAFGLAIAHILQSVAHHWQWRWQSWRFLVVQHQWAIAAGVLAMVCLLPAALTSFGAAQRSLGVWWRRLHLLTLPALLLALTHAVLIGPHFLGGSQLLPYQQALTIIVIGLGVGVVWLRSRWGLSWLRQRS